jgi:hypothetical protein
VCAQTAVELAMSFWGEIILLDLALPLGATWCHSDHELAQGGGLRRKEGQTDGGVAPLLKSRGPPLASREKILAAFKNRNVVPLSGVGKCPNYWEQNLEQILRYLKLMFKITEVRHLPTSAYVYRLVKNGFATGL